MIHKTASSNAQILQVAVAAPAHSDLPSTLSYTSEQTLAPGSLVRVPFGSREVLGVVWAADAFVSADEGGRALKPIAGVLPELAALSRAWRDLVEFAARYYQRALGEVALAALPPQLREQDGAALARRMKRQAQREAGADRDVNAAPFARAGIDLSAEQSDALERFFSEMPPRPALLFGSTGSGKTEVYLHAVARALEAGGPAQALVMVPEINLTPQLQERFSERFGADGIVTMHSAMTPAQRLQAWLLAHSGRARIVLGTRMSIFASMPHLRLIVVDEEHDSSYRSQDGARHSARDLAVMRAKLEGEHSGQTCRILLGSATPSLESWQASSVGRYARLEMPSRIGGARLPELKLADMRVLPRKTLFAPQLLAALDDRIQHGEQALIFLNRRGYAPVLACDACGWKSACPHCSGFRVFHKADSSLRCHHCGYTERVPRKCPDCGNVDIQPVGRGTQKIEEQLALALGLEIKRPDGSDVVIGRIDADSTRHKGALQTQLAQVHSGGVDILIGTQMITKGHDFRRITLVAAIDADAALFSSDFRAPERLFALLLQASGRAGRDVALQRHDATSGQRERRAQMWVQTNYPRHPLFAALAKHDYPGFAAQQLMERKQAQLPPFSFQALLRAEARTQSAAQAFLLAAHELAQEVAPAHVTVYPPVPMGMQRIANVERAQMLLESGSRSALQAFLSAWLPQLRALKTLPQCKGLIRFAIDVDPMQI